MDKRVEELVRDYSGPYAPIRAFVCIAEAMDPDVEDPRGWLEEAQERLAEFLDQEPAETARPGAKLRGDDEEDPKPEKRPRRPRRPREDTPAKKPAAGPRRRTDLLQCKQCGETKGITAFSRDDVDVCRKCKREEG